MAEINHAEWRQDLLQTEIHSRIETDLRTIPGTFLGMEKHRVFSDAIGGGQANFDEEQHGLSGDDRALLYAKFNQQRHLDELDYGFAQLFTDVKQARNPTILDVGCGPFTAGLSLAHTLGAQEPFRYFGIDRSQAMLRLGGRLAEGARKRSALNPATSIFFSPDLKAIDFGFRRGELTVIVASYLLASGTLEVKPMVADLMEALDRIGPGPAAVLYTNSAAERATAKYPEFRDEFGQQGFEVQVEDVDLFMHTKMPKRMHYALLFRPERRIIQLSKGTS